MSTNFVDPRAEKEIITRAQKDKKYFSELYKNYYKNIQQFFVFRINDPIMAEDLTSKVFEKALKGLNNFRWQGLSFSSWLYKISRNCLIDYYREIAKSKKQTNLDDSLEIKSEEKSLPEQYENLISEEILHKLIDNLPAKEREIILMKFFDGYTNRLISQITGLTETNVGTIVYRTIKKLKTYYQENY